MDTHPTQLEIVDQTQLQIGWSDGQIRRYAIQELRHNCPCATCREKRKVAQEEPAGSPQLNILSPAETQPLRIVSMKPVGNYAYSIVFADGHDSGIFTFELLLELGREASSM